MEEDIDTSLLAHQKSRYNCVVLPEGNTLVLDLLDIDAFIDTCTKYVNSPALEIDFDDAAHNKREKTYIDKTDTPLATPQHSTAHHPYNVKPHQISTHAVNDTSTIQIDTRNQLVIVDIADIDTEIDSLLLMDNLESNTHPTDIHSYNMQNSHIQQSSIQTDNDNYEHNHEEMLNLSSHTVEDTHKNSLDDFYAAVKLLNVNEKKNTTHHNNINKDSFTLKKSHKPKITMSNTSNNNLKHNTRIPEREKTSTPTRNHNKNNVLEPTLNIFDRSLYAILLSLFYATGGVIIDVSIAVLQAIFANNFNAILWLFTPLLLVIGFFVGFMSNQDQVLKNAPEKIEKVSLSGDIINGVLVAVVISVVVWVFLMLVM